VTSVVITVSSAAPGPVCLCAYGLVTTQPSAGHSPSHRQQLVLTASWLPIPTGKPLKFCTRLKAAPKSLTEETVLLVGISGFSLMGRL